MAVDAEPAKDTWYGQDQKVSQFRGVAFKYTTLVASFFGIAMVAILLTKVFLDAVRPTTADPAWLATFGVVFVLPSLALLTYYARANPRAGWTGALLSAVPVFGLIFGTGIVVLFIEVLSPLEWFGMFVGLVVTIALVLAHRIVRRQRSGERTLLGIILLVVTIVGIPNLGMGFEVLSLSEMVQLYSPILPSDGAIIFATLALPVAAGAGYRTVTQREDTRVGWLLAAGILAGAVLAFVLGPTIGVSPGHAVLLTIAVITPTCLYAAAVYWSDHANTSFALPVAVYGCLAFGIIIVNTLGFSGPEAWIDWQFLTALPSRTPEEAGFYPAIIGSIMIMLVIIIGIFPVGVAAAIYLEEYAATDGLLGSIVDLIEINIANLAGVPSVVYGLLALGVFINTMGMGTGTVVVGGFAVGLLILPIIIISSQEAIRAVPSSHRQASYGMGATKWQTVRNVVLPEALPGILTGSILAFGRAIGETAPLLMIGVAGVVFKAPSGFFAKTSAMPRQIYAWSSQPSDEFRYGVLAAGVITLLVVLLAMNASAIIIRNKYQRSQ